MNSANQRRAQTGWRALALWLRIRFFSLDQPLFWLMMAIFVLSLFAVYSASHDDPDRFINHLRN
ncbi:MAG: hypothetical protein EB068_05085, partial [Betaproteobacteria bacterium]|nr:hypothetical protein [Betaproteobacteria bacterium]